MAKEITVKEFPKGIRVDEMRSMVDGLDAIEAEACGFGTLTKAEIQVEMAGSILMTAIYTDGEWLITIESATKE